MKETLLWIDDGEDFCGGAVFAMDPPICIDAADKIYDLCINRGLDKIVAFCLLKGWKYEIIKRS